MASLHIPLILDSKIYTDIEIYRFPAFINDQAVAASGHFSFFFTFYTIKDKFCRRSLCNTFMLISEFYGFNREKHHGMTFSNLVLENHCINFIRRSGKEPILKILYLYLFELK